MSFLYGFLKIAVIDMASDAALLANAPMQTYVPGREGVERESGQARGKVQRTMAENKNIPSSNMRGWPNARNMGKKEN